ncbi:hypothetical protein ABZ154_26250 [Streptomyces sp. NPDC006261]|uniref:hypothetical protein n=1 Tax=Streptomyces sp. NPDC006261 TaxID=3156739 RepID=UPI0033A381C6
MAAGVVLFLVMAFLLRQGTTSMVLFLTYGVLAMVGVGGVAMGKKISDRERGR